MPFNIKLCRAGNELAHCAIPVTNRRCIYTHNGFPQLVTPINEEVYHLGYEHTAVVKAYFLVASMVMPVRLDYLYSTDEWLQLTGSTKLNP